MDQEPYAVHVEGIAARPRAPSIVIAAIVAGVLLAVLKPWSFGGSGSPDGRSPPPPPGGPGVVLASPTPSASPQVDPSGMACLGGDVEQVVAFERSGNDEVRNWIAVDDVPVTGPLDPRIARITIYSSHVVGLGICGPYAGEGIPVAGRLIDVQLAPTRPGEQAKDLGRPRQITLELGDQDAAVLYGSPQDIVVPGGGLPPSPASDGSGVVTSPTLRPWSRGVYAIAFVFAADGSQVVRWIGIELVPGAGEPR